ncbi:SWR1 [Sanghuangporus weigelae]
MVRNRAKSTAFADTQPELHASTSHATPSAVRLEREDLIQERQHELGEIFSRHDTLIREQFMLENYGLMLFYDPDVAKQDQTNEFLQFKNRHDLMRYMPGAGPSRATRRAQTDRISALSQVAGQSVSAPVPSKQSFSATKPNGIAHKSSATAKGKQRQTDASPIAGIADYTHASAKARGKRKVLNESPEPGGFSDADPGMDSISSRLKSSKGRGLPKVAGDLYGESSRTSRSQSIITDDSSSTRLTARSSRKSLRHERASSSEFTRPTKKRRLPDDGSTQRHLRITLPPPSTKSPLPPTDRPTTSGKSLPGKTLPSIAAPRPTIRRIKLIVRPPARTYSSPRQRPDPAVFGYSVPKLLASYIEIDGKSYTSAELESRARRDARILDRLDELKQKGRYPGQKLFGSDTSSKHQPADIWSEIVSEVIATRQSLSRHRFGHGGALAAVVHSKLHAHWDLLKKDLQREQVLEERRLRALSKSILKLVLAEWKRAVFHVREQQRLAFEAEEARRGRQHLDAILDQSGQILERQQLELIRSESSNVDSDDDDDEDEEEEATDLDDSGEDNEGEDNESNEAATDVDEEEEEDVASVEHEREKHVDFVIPLNDADEGEREFSVEIDEQGDFSVHSSQVDDVDEDTRFSRELEGSRTPADELDIREEMEVVRESTPQDNGFADEDRSPEADLSSSKASPESSSFMRDLLPSDIGMHPESDGMPHLGLANGFEHGEPIVVHSEPIIEGQVESIFIPTKAPSPLKSVPEFKEEASPVDVAMDIPTRTTEPKLPNEHAVRLNHSDSNEPLTNGLNEAKAEGEVAKEVASVFAEVDGQNEASMVVDDAVPSPAPVTDREVDQPAQTPTEDKVEDQESSDEGVAEASESESEWEAPPELQSYAVVRVKWEPGSKVLSPLLLRGTLRPYQQSGLEWLVSLHNNETNGILADEMGLGKTIQTIALLAHLACDRGIWGPHLIIVPTSVLLNWEMEFKKFLPGFKVLSYHGTTKRRKELRRGWNDKYGFNVCITSYTLASRDQHIFKRKAWYYMVLDEAHMIKNFRSQRWNILLMFRSQRRLLLTGTPLQNNLTELWALLRFLMSGANFANQKEFTEWFGIPLEKAIEVGNLQDQAVQEQVMKLHEMLRPFLLRRLKKDVEKELPKKYEHLVLCRLSKRQRFLYDEFMSRRRTREDLQSGVYQKIANILMQLRKVCNHPNLFEVRPIVTSFAMEKSAIADFEIKELLIRRTFLAEEDRSSHVNLDAVGLQFTHLCNTSRIAAQSARSLEEVLAAELIAASPGEPPARDLRTIEGYRKYNAYQRRMATYLRYQQMVYLNRLRCKRHILYGLETINMVKRMYNPLTTACEAELMSECRSANHLVKSHLQRAGEMEDLVEKFAFATPTAVARDMPEIALREVPPDVIEALPVDFDTMLHKPAVKLQIAFPDVSLLQYDCGKLQELDRLLRERKSGGHRVLIFTQMTRILDILEVFLNFHGYLYLRLDGATKIEDRQYITERFNADPRIFAFIASSRSGGIGINLTGADTVIFYDSDFNPQMDKQCEDRAHRIGQIRDVHIYRFISQYTVEEAMLRKANQKRSLDDIVIQKGDFDWKNFFRSSGLGDSDGSGAAGGSSAGMVKASALQKALVEFEDFEDAEAAKVAAREEAELLGEDKAEFDVDADGDEGVVVSQPQTPSVSFAGETTAAMTPGDEDVEAGDDAAQEEGAEEEEGGTTVDYMIKFVRSDLEYFKEWRLP